MQMRFTLRVAAAGAKTAYSHVPYGHLRFFRTPVSAQIAMPADLDGRSLHLFLVSNYREFKRPVSSYAIISILFDK